MFIFPSKMPVGYKSSPIYLGIVGPFMQQFLLENPTMVITWMKWLEQDELNHNFTMLDMRALNMQVLPGPGNRI